MQSKGQAFLTSLLKEINQKKKKKQRTYTEEFSRQKLWKYLN